MLIDEETYEPFRLCQRTRTCLTEQSGSLGHIGSGTILAGLRRVLSTLLFLLPRFLLLFWLIDPKGEAVTTIRGSCTTSRSWPDT